ncbi:MAG: hypothetical protein C4523_10410 [Myxococcales bacterium]|nr:MAG: hypothetical protein C4523_10410 [Myxococcales bacterium]
MSWRLVLVAMALGLLLMSCTTAEVSNSDGDQADGDDSTDGDGGCAPDAYRCRGDDVERCENGSWVFHRDCGLNGESCFEGSCFVVTPPDGDPTDSDPADDEEAPENDIPDGDSEPDGDISDGDEADGDGADGDGADGDAPETGMVGSACEENENCLTELCLTTSIISMLTDNEIEIVNGYCSTFQPDICTRDVNGHNVSAVILGPAFAHSKICLAPCETDTDCRPDEAVTCFDPSMLVEDGYLTEEEVLVRFGGEHVCLPQGMLEAMLQNPTGCAGACNPARDSTFCVDGNVCVCNGGQWNLYNCDVVCAGQGSTSDGCGPNSTYSFDYCLCRDEPTDGDAPTDCEGACNPSADAPYCSATAELFLCWCDEEASVWEALDCSTVCEDAGYEQGAQACDYGAEQGYDICYCKSGECESDEDCDGNDFCVAVLDAQGHDHMECVQSCEINTCDPGADTIACIDFGPAGQPVGLCADFDNTETCETQGEACIDENHYCFPLRDYNACWAYCDVLVFENSCEGGNELCLPLTDSDGRIYGGGCL